MKTLDIRVAFSALDKLSRPVNAARQSVGGLSESLKKTEFAIKDLSRQSEGFNRLRDSVKKTSRRIDEASRTLSGLNKVEKEGGQLTDKQRELISSLSAKLERLNVVRSKEMEKLRGASQALRRHGVSLAGGDQTIQSAIRRTEQYNQTLERERRNLAAVTRAQARYSRMKEMGGQLQGAGMSTVTAGAAVVAPVAAAVKSYSSLEDAMKGVTKQVDGLRDSEGKRTSRYTEMQNAIKNASENLPMPGGAVDYAALVEGGARMGVANDKDPWEKQKSDLLNFATTAAMASKAFELPADKLSEDLGKIAGLYKIPIQEIGSLGDVLNYLDDKTLSKGADIIDVMQRIGGAADQLGYQNAAALGSTFLSLGETSEKAGTAVAAMVRELGNAMIQPDRFYEGLDALGLNAEKIQKNMATDALGTIVDVLDATKKLAPDRQKNVLTQLFGEEYFMAISKVANDLPELRRQLELTHTTASKGSMKRESDIDKDSLSSQWLITKASLNNTFSSLGESLRAPVMEIMQSVGKVLQSLRRWIDANPELTASIMKFIAGVGIALAVIGSLMLAVGAILGPLALMRLSFNLLAGEGGIVRMITGVSRLGGALQWLSGVPVRGLLTAGRAAFGPLITLLAGLSAPVWGLIALFAVVAIGIIKFWQPIKAFFGGFFSGLMQGLQPIFSIVSTAFSPLAGIFDAIGSAVGTVWGWFTKLFEPIQFSSDALKSCTSAGETFGRVLGSALSALLWPMQQLMKGIGWVLEKLGLIPSGLDAARLKAESLRKEPVVWEWDPKQKKMVKKEWNWSPTPVKTPGAFTPPEITGNKPPRTPLTGSNSNQKNLQKIADNTGGMLKETKKRIGPGDIVFKNLPRALAVRGEWQESRLAPPPAMTTSRLAPVIKAASQPVIQAILPPVKTPADTARNDRAAAGFGGDIHVHLHNVTTDKPRELARLVGEMVREEMTRLSRTGRSSFKDQD